MFGVMAALILAAGAMLTTASSGTAAPGISAGAIAVTPMIPDGNPFVQKVGHCGPWNGWCGGSCGQWNNWCHGGGGGCGPWNNWCNGGGGGGGGACINFGGISFCTDVGGSNCRWHNGKKYCYGGGGGGGGKDCTWYQGDKYCNWKKGGDCIWRKGQKYCTGWN
jgi:hypothetical protein